VGTADEILDQAQDKAANVVESLIDGVQDERDQEVDIKEQHAERYFQHEIRKHEDRLRKYEKEAVDTEKDMQVAIDSTRAEIRKLEEEWEEEQKRLDRERQIIPDEPELVNAAFVAGTLPALTTADIPSPQNISDMLSGDSMNVTFVPSHAAADGVSDLTSAARLIRPADISSAIDDLERVSVGGHKIWCDSSQEREQHDRQALESFQKQLGSILNKLDAEVTVGLCSTDQSIDAVLHEGEILCNVRLRDEVPDRYWQIVMAREVVFADQSIPAERRYERIEQLLE
jgi:hypothetical protein